MTKGKQCLASNVVAVEVQVVVLLLGMLSSLAYARFVTHYKRTSIKRVTCDETDWVVTCGRSCTARVSANDGIACQCVFHRQWRMPRAHMWHASLLLNKDSNLMARGCRWLLPQMHDYEVVQECDVFHSVEVQRRRRTSGTKVTDRASKLHAWQQLSADIGAQVCSYGTERFSRSMTSGC